MLESAPSLQAVRDHIIDIYKSKEKDLQREVKFIGHSVKQDLLVLGLSDLYYVDTQRFYGPEQPKGLKDLGESVLNVKIQEGIHSSIIDARVSLALFLANERNIEYRDYLERQSEK